MKKALFLSLVLIAVSGFVFTDTLYAHQPSYNDEDVKIEAKKIDKGITVSVTSDDPETVGYIQTHIPWYERMFRKIFTFSDMMQGHRGMHGMRSSNCPMM